MQFFANSKFYVDQSITKLAIPISILFNIQTEKLYKQYCLCYSILIINILSLACHMQNKDIFTLFLGTQIH